jgi:phosphoglycolate phosphatase-like HAD superfamily hydrolase
MTRRPTRVVLFDIDGTLLWTDGAGRRAMHRALETVFGHVGDAGYRYDGKTDRQIIREQMRGGGESDARIDAAMDTVLEHYTSALGEELLADGGASRVCDGVPTLLDAVDADRGLVNGLLTGNIVGGAQQKLRAVGVDFQRFRVGAFGSDHEARPQLPHVARVRASTLLGHEVRGEELVIIGDTPSDIACGRALGVRAIGVATGRYSVDELASHAPFAVFPNLTDTEAVMAAIGCP